MKDSSIDGFLETKQRGATMTKNRKKFQIILVAVLIFALAFSFSACGKDKGSDEGNDPPVSSGNDEGNAGNDGGNNGETGADNGSEVEYGVLDESTRIYTTGNKDATYTFKLPENWRVDIDDMKNKGTGHVTMSNNKGGDEYLAVILYVYSESSYATPEEFMSSEAEFTTVTVGGTEYLTNVEAVSGEGSIYYAANQGKGTYVFKMLYRRVADSADFQSIIASLTIS